MNIKSWVTANLSPLLDNRAKNTIKSALGWWYRNDLNRLAMIFHTDKWGSHWYTRHYDRYFRSIRSKRLNILEIGVGGYAQSHLGAGSLKMWKNYFRKSQIAAIDIFDKTPLSEKRIDIRQCDQTDTDSLLRLSEEYGGFDIIIDDGSHINEHVIKTFEALFPVLRVDGIYAVEDTQTAYWPGWGGGMGNHGTSMAYFKNLVDGLNYMEYPLVGYSPTVFDKSIVEIAFFHNLIIVRKGINQEKPNAPELILHELEAARNTAT
jgi:hypothetical protein